VEAGAIGYLTKNISDAPGDSWKMPGFSENDEDNSGEQYRIRKER
jgi:hypothetical protein